MKLRAVSILVLTVLILSGLRVFLARADCTSGGSDPGVVVVVGETPIAMQFELAPGIDYKFNYPANLALWTTPLRTTAIPSGSVFTNGSGPVFGDANGDGQVQLDDLIFIRNRLGTPHTASDLNASGLVDQNDLVLCRNALGAGPTRLTVYVEGLSASTSLCDMAIQLLTDPNHTGAFAIATTTSATIASITISPTVGAIGTPISISLQPAISPMVFNASTSAQWRGVYQPSSGPSTTPFDVQFGPLDFRESGVGTALILIGSGTYSNLPALEAYASSGTLEGVLTLDLGGVSLRRQCALGIQGRGAIWETIEYPESGLTAGPPALGGEPADLPLLEYSYDPNPPRDIDLQHSYLYHLAAVLRVPETSYTIPNAPNSFNVDIATFDVQGHQIDRRHGIQLTRIDADGDAANITYSSHVVKPIVLVDVPVDPDLYHNVTVLRAGEGIAVILPAQ